MDKLRVLYDSKLITKDSELYIKEIEKNIPSCIKTDIAYCNEFKEQGNYILIKPYHKDFKVVGGNNIEFDENGLSVTAEAILRVMPEDLKGSRVYIINQSETVGIPLAVALMRKGATVTSMGSKSRVKFELLDAIPDIIISATGDEFFLLDETFTKRALILIDLSHDLKDKRAWRNVPTVEVLKERLMEMK